MSVPAAARLPSRPALRRLIEFYETKGPDNRGRLLEEILKWSDERLEFSHDYIQTLFPLPEGSMFANAPVVDEETFLYWRQSGGELNANMRRALERMLSFYGFAIEWQDHEKGGSTAEVTVKAGGEANLARWVVRMDHNHLRITRIIRSLRVLGLTEEARAFYAALVWTCDTYGRIGSSSRKFWKRAIELPLHIAPDGTEVEWLEKYDGGEDTAENDIKSDGSESSVDQEGNTAAKQETN
ncbi:hypothetical protein JX266_012172 [Neoarthrinium moseri]|nr:hypothetical protein JX266_012172 [Neoarthrinium moseri]